jgi:hypothetical protein
MEIFKTRTERSKLFSRLVKEYAKASGITQKQCRKMAEDFWLIGASFSDGLSLTMDGDLLRHTEDKDIA